MNTYLIENTLQHLDLIKNTFENKIYDRIKKLEITHQINKCTIFYSIIFTFDDPEIEPIYHSNTIFYNIEIDKTNFKISIVTEKVQYLLDIDDIDENYYEIASFLSKVPKQLYSAIEGYFKHN